ncbi:hypothetical protein pipiens_008762 [Culex pipiens pipiens]|uniref:CUB domain-containing protein n=1 Tax=Culex pipiens pipiens TaxID=38569 RepID=A0ABD1DG65_CULPP
MACVALAAVLVQLIMVMTSWGGGVSAQFAGPTLACGGTSLLKMTTLISPAQIGTNGGAASSCTYTIRAMNLRVCQLRLDFNTFNLAQPTADPYPRCVNDVLTIENMDFHLCGANDGQHIYVPFSPTYNDMTMTIDFKLAGRTLGEQAPYWNIRVQQLECPVGPAFASKLANRFIPEIPPPSGKTFSNDLATLAPTGCLQYFTAPTGTIKSFNFGPGPYIGDTNYAICFRRTRANRILSLHADVFDLGYVETGGMEWTDNECYSNIPTPGRSEDYLFIQDGHYVAAGGITRRASRFCGQSIIQNTVETSSPGPFVVYFNSDKLIEASREMGFHITYEIV